MSEAMICAVIVQLGGEGEREGEGETDAGLLGVCLCQLRCDRAPALLSHHLRHNIRGALKLNFKLFFPPQDPKSRITAPEVVFFFIPAAL